MSTVLQAIAKQLEAFTNEMRADREERYKLLGRLFEDRERTRSQVIKVARAVAGGDEDNRRAHRTDDESRIPLLVEGKIGIRAMPDLYELQGNPGLFRSFLDSPGGKVTSSRDPQIIGVHPTALGQELAFGEEWLVRVRIDGDDPDAWDWHDWKKL